jgi:Flp pilus assembly protein TadD
MKKLFLTLVVCLVYAGAAWAHSDIDSLPPAVAVLSYKQILYLNPDDLSARNGLAMALVRTNKLQEAQKELHYILKKDPNNFDALDGYGVLLIKAGKHKDALQYLSKAASINKEDTMLYVHLSVVYDKMRDRDKAEAALKKAQSLASPDELKKIEAERRFLYGK